MYNDDFSKINMDYLNLFKTTPSESYVSNANIVSLSSKSILVPKSNYYKYFKDHRKYSSYYVIEKYLSFYPLFLIIIGTICNLTSFFIMHKKNMSKHSCMRYLSILSLTDVIVLYQWNLNTFFKYNLSIPPMYSDLEEISLFWCRSISYLAFSSLQLSSWLLSLVSFDRCMIIYSQWWRKNIMSEPKVVNLIIICLASSIFLLNSHILFLNGYKTIEVKNKQTTNAHLVNSRNDTSNFTTLLAANTFNTSFNYEETVVCYKSLHDNNYIFPNWQRVHLFMYNFIPFFIMFTCNAMIIYNIKFDTIKTRIKTKSKSSNRRKTRTSFMLILVTFSFMFLTLPSVIVHTFFREFLSNKPYRRLVNMIVNNLLHTSHAIDFFLYVFTAPNFRAELKTFFSSLAQKCGLSNRDRDLNMSLRKVTTNRSSMKSTITKKSNSNANANLDKINKLNECLLENEQEKPIILSTKST